MQVFKIVAFIMIFCFIVFFPLKHYLRKRFISWEQDRKLTWKDFKGSQPEGFHHNAGTACFYKYSEKLVKDSIEIEMDNCFSIYSSFVLRGHDNSYILNHEQRHFDINEIYVRRIRECISNWKGKTKTDYNSYLVNGINKIFSDSLQYLYDKEIYGTHWDSTNQDHWNKVIDSTLKIYSRFKLNKFRLHWPSPVSDFKNNSFDYYRAFHSLKTNEQERPKYSIKAYLN